MIRSPLGIGPVLDGPTAGEQSDEVRRCLPLAYLTTAEVAQRLRISTKTLRNRVAAGLFQRGEHFFRPAGMQPLWKWEAVVERVENMNEQEIARPEHLPLARSQNRGR